MHSKLGLPVLLFSLIFPFSLLFSVCFRIAKHHSPRRGTSEVKCQRGFKNQVHTQILEGWSVFNHCTTSHEIGLSLQRAVRDGCWGWASFGWDGEAQEDWKGLPGNPEEIRVRRTPPAVSGASYLYMNVFGFGFPCYLMWEILEFPCSLRLAIRPWRTSICEAVIPLAALQWYSAFRVFTSNSPSITKLTFI